MTNVFMFLSLGSSVISLLLGGYVYHLNLRSTENRFFALGCLFMALFSFIEFKARQAPDYETGYFWVRLHVFWPLIIAFALHFILVYTGKSRLLRNILIYMVIYLPAAFFVIINRFTSLVMLDVAEKKYWGYTYVLASDSWMLVINSIWLSGSIILFCILGIHFLLTTADRKKRSQMKFLFGGISITAFTGFVTERLLPVLRIDCPPLTSVSLALMAICIAFAVRRYELFMYDPSDMAEQLFLTVPEAMLLTDIDHKIIKVNAPLLELIEYMEHELIGEHVHSLFKEQEIAVKIIGRLFEKKQLSSHETILAAKSGREIPVLFSGSVLMNRKSEPGGIIGIFRNISERKNAEESIRMLAFYDQLTRLPNRNLFMDRLYASLAMAHRHGQICALLFLDIDDFKRINDSLGHSFGDKLIKEVAAQMLKCLRKEDTVTKDQHQVFLDTIARIGGDEFLILLSEINDPANAAIVAERICQTLHQPFLIDGREIKITVSIGIAIYPNDGTDSETLIKNADLAMYKAKSLDKDNYQYYNFSMNINAMNRMNVETELWKALEHGDFVLHYQPLFDLKTGALKGAEALIRWQHPEKGMLLPQDFIQIAEDTGLIVNIGNWILKTVSDTFRGFIKDIDDNFKIMINISPKQLHHWNFPDTILRMANDCCILPGHFILEITENSIMNNLESMVNIIHELKSMGIKLALDDFGTGFFSLSVFNWIPFDIIKIDRSYIRNIPAVHKDMIIVESFISIGHSMNLEVIAEGIETWEQLHFLRSKACETGQGFYFNRPVPGDVLLQMIKNKSFHPGIPEK